MHITYVIGLDIGGTKIEGVLAKATAISSLPKVLKKVRTPTDAAAGRSKVLNNIAAAITALCDYGRQNIKGFRLNGIGIGTAGFLKNDRLEMVPNIPAIKGVRLKQVLRRQLRRKGIKAPLFIENDSICFALAESMFGAAKSRRNVVGVIVGTGIGGGLVLDGKIYRGRDGGAGHIGHMNIDPSGPRCGCGQLGHFESWCSGKYITQRYIAAGGKIPNPDPRKIFHSKEAVARKIMLETYEKFGIAFANIINIFNPEVIVIGGGVSNLPAEFYRKINVAAKKYAYRAFSSGLKIVKNKLGDSAGVFGAAALPYNSSYSSSSW
ncbi:ROK family protein [Candidatus Woesearchaeota archaeon]|nr:ROK family protein [Candidatus Woesearchaeota archaeon]